MPLFLAADPAESTGLISIALDDGSFNKNTPGILVALLSQSRASLRKIESLSSIAMVIRWKISTHILRLAVP
jgi:hypothetical protein